MKKRCLFNFVLLGFVATANLCFCQTTTSYSVYKLENKIGQEVASSSLQDNSTAENISIITNDRGSALMLKASYTAVNNTVKYTSNGNTSRFTTENIDTAFSIGGSFPCSKNGSIKMRELLVSFWNKAGRPAFIPSAINGNRVNIEVMGKEKDPLHNTDLTVIAIKDDLDEVFWIDDKGSSIYLSTCDAEGDKREVINDNYQAHFNTFNHQSNQYLIKKYLADNKELGKAFDDIAIVGGNIIDVTDSGKVRYNSMLLLKNGKIDYIGDIDKAIIPAGAQVIDASNKFLIPGLWNMHVHLFHPQYLRNELLSGVTTVRDMGNEFDFITALKEAVSAKNFPAPHILNAGLLDGNSSNSLGIMRATNEAEIKANVKKYHDAGFNQIKIYSYIKKNDFITIVKEARLYNMDVVGHLPIGYTVGYFIDNGMNSISHIHYFMNNLKFGGKDLKADNKALLDKMIEKKIYLDPTLNVYTLTGDKKIPFYNILIKLFFDYGIPIVAGTDNEGTVITEIQSYAKLGINPLNAIRAATIIPATLMKLNAQSGSIEKGKDADILLLNANPLLNMDALNNIDTIIKGQLIIKKMADK
ncbi:amidohydrolase family protein [Mucilaginibacter sp.]|uniref:amidohydrolase family protein n=1 Tax=Mucilaginibacter sp. TaxID=1882438 RepID=UPI003D0AF5F4